MCIRDSNKEDYQLAVKVFGYEIWFKKDWSPTLHFNLTTEVPVSEHFFQACNRLNGRLPAGADPSRRLSTYPEINVNPEPTPADLEWPKWVTPNMIRDMDAFAKDYAVVHGSNILQYTREKTLLSLTPAGAMRRLQLACILDYIEYATLMAKVLALRAGPRPDADRIYTICKEDPYSTSYCMRLLDTYLVPPLSLIHISEPTRPY